MEKRVVEGRLACRDRVRNMHLLPGKNGYTFRCIHLDGPGDPLRRLAQRYDRRLEEILQAL